MTGRPDMIEKSIKETAAYWAVRLSSPDCTPEDRCGFEAWRRADTEHQEAFNRQQRGAAFVDRNVAHPILQALAEEVHSETEPGLFHKSRWKFAAIAASLFLAIGVSTILVTSSFNSNGSTQFAAIESYETAIGERSTITLADGTALTLNTNSKVEVDFKAEQRDIRLLRGQALFEVAKDINRPFVVRAGDQRIVALGTAFDVRLDDLVGVQVTLIEGSVSVEDVLKTPPANPASFATNELSDAIELRPGERLIAKVDTETKVQQADIKEVTSWRDGRLVFRKKPLPDVIAEMNRYSAQQLVLSDDDRLKEMTVSGVFSTGRASGFVYALETMQPLKAERTGQRELTLVWRE
jgi:transmembrane sensor